jgi:hypothetical protein
MGGAMGQDTGLRASKGWIGGVAGSEAVWVGFETMDEIRIVRVEYGLDHLSRFSESLSFSPGSRVIRSALKMPVMTTVPLPAFPLGRLALALAAEGGGDTTRQKSTLDGLIFVSKSQSASRVKTEDEPDLQHSDEDQEGIRVILVSTEESKQIPLRLSLLR